MLKNHVTMDKTFILKNRISVNRKKKKKEIKKSILREKRSSCAYFYYEIKFDTELILF